MMLPILALSPPDRKDQACPTPLRGRRAGDARPALHRLLLGVLFLLAGCQPLLARAPVKPLAAYSGQGPGEVRLDAPAGPVVLRLTASAGRLPFRALAVGGLESTELVQAESSLEAYRGMVVDPQAGTALRIEGDRSWQVEVFPLQAASFDRLKVPGTYTGRGNAVFALQGKNGVATFDTDRAQPFAAWAIGENQKWERLKITATGAYKGKSVLPTQTQVIIVSASGPWSVLIQQPCCDNIPQKKTLPVK